MSMAVLAAILAIGFASYAEWRHFKNGNGRRFEQIHELLNQRNK
jgi:hypothetical protein